MIKLLLLGTLRGPVSNFTHMSGLWQDLDLEILAGPSPCERGIPGTTQLAWTCPQATYCSCSVGPGGSGLGPETPTLVPPA